MRSVLRFVAVNLALVALVGSCALSSAVILVIVDRHIPFDAAVYLYFPAGVAGIAAILLIAAGIHRHINRPSRPRDSARARD